MGFYIEYFLHLAIKPEHVAKALEILNYLHTDEMLLKHARGVSYPRKGSVKDYCHYSFALNPDKPYTSLSEAFRHWCVVEKCVKMEENEEHGFEISGHYSCKLGQQDFLIEQLAPVLCDTRILVHGEDCSKWSWVVENHKFSTVEEENDSESDASSETEQRIDAAQIKE